MKLADMTVAQFVAATASEEPAPGGGSVAALEAAQAVCGLPVMCTLTLEADGHLLFWDVPAADDALRAALAQYA